MSSSDTPGLVRTTGLDPTEAETVALEEEVARLRRSVETLEAELSRTERERDALAEDLEHTTAWSEFLDRELRDRGDRIESLERDLEAEAARREEVVDRYETLLAEARGGGADGRWLGGFDGLLARIGRRVGRLGRLF